MRYGMALLNERALKLVKVAFVCCISDTFLQILATETPVDQSKIHPYALIMAARAQLVNLVLVWRRQAFDICGGLTIMPVLASELTQGWHQQVRLLRVRNREREREKKKKRKKEQKKRVRRSERNRERGMEGHDSNQFPWDEVGEVSHTAPAAQQPCHWHSPKGFRALLAAKRENRMACRKVPQ